MDKTVSLRLQRLAVHLLDAGAAAQAVIAGGETATPPPPHAFDIEDAQALKTVGGIALSPCEGWVAYTVSEKDLKEDKGSSSLWMVSTGGGNPIRMSAPGLGASSPEFSPDGKMLCFTAARPIPPVVSGLDETISTTQVWAHHLGPGGDAQPLTFVRQGISSFSWSPDLDRPRLLLTITDPAPDIDEEEKERNKPKPWVMERQQFKRDYAGYLHNRLGKSHLYVQEGGQLTQITSGEWDEGSAEWSPCGAKVAFASNRTTNPDANSCSNIWVVSADNSDQGKTLVQVTANGGAGDCADDGHSNGSPKWSPDGRSIVYSTSPSHPTVMWYSTSHLAIAAADGSDAANGGRILTRKLDRNLHGAEYSAQGHCIYATLTDRGCSHLCTISLADAKEEEVSLVIGGEVSVSSWKIVGDTIVTLMSTAKHPGEIFVLEGHAAQKDRPLRRVSHVNDSLLSSVTLGEVEKIVYPCKDVRTYTHIGSRPMYIDTVNDDVEMFVFKPPGFTEGFKYPCILWIHGGPVSQYDWGFSAPAQLFANHGYVVLQVNPRGSTGRGEEFCAALYCDWGGPGLHDVLTAVDYAVDELGIADPNRLCVGGWSYGGILTNHVITKTQHRFKAAMTGASSTLYRASYGHDQYQLHWEQELGLPWENAEGWEAISPFNDVSECTTPTLVVCGEVDWNVPVQNSDQLYQALKRLGVDTELVVYPDEHHGISLPSFERDRYERWLQWFDKYTASATA